MARWTRAIAALPFATGRVLDLGCAFGFATRLLRRRGYEAVGVDSSPVYIARARRADPRTTYLVADATRVPLSDASFDGVLLLDVLEHLPDERGALDEAARLLVPGGTLVLSVPYRGPLARLDSLNLYARFVGLTHHGRFPPEIAPTGVHRHYSVADLRALLGEAFELRRVRRTGIGLAELVHLPVLLLFRWLAPFEPLYAAAAFAYYTCYLAEDLLPLGPLGYHLMLTATRREEGTGNAEFAELRGGRGEGEPRENTEETEETGGGGGRRGESGKRRDSPTPPRRRRRRAHFRQRFGPDTRAFSARAIIGGTRKRKSALAVEHAGTSHMTHTTETSHSR